MIKLNIFHIFTTSENVAYLLHLQINIIIDFFLNSSNDTTCTNT